MRKAILWAILWLTTAPVSGQEAGLFDVREILEISFSGNVPELMNDRGDDPQYHAFTLAYTDPSGRVELPVRIKARGHFRKLRENCTYPPLLINFPSGDQEKTIFREQNKLKLVTPCREEKFVIREYLVYNIYALTTPRSFRARLVKFTFINTAAKGKGIEPLYGILLEEEEQMAKRNQAVAVERKLLQPQQTEKDDFLNMAVFEYMIGNTDWSVQYLQNVKLIAADSLATPITVPYDFDHAGLVGAPYAYPAPELALHSTRERRFRGYCLTDMKEFDAVKATYQRLKQDIYALYTDNTLIEESYRKATLRYLDEFYATLDDPKKLKAEFQYPCRANGTGNVVIKGLKQE